MKPPPWIVVCCLLGVLVAAGVIRMKSRQDDRAMNAVAMLRTDVSAFRSLRREDVRRATRIAVPTDAVSADADIGGRITRVGLPSGHILREGDLIPVASEFGRVRIVLPLAALPPLPVGGRAWLVREGDGGKPGRVIARNARVVGGTGRSVMVAISPEALRALAPLLGNRRRVLVVPSPIP